MAEKKKLAARQLAKRRSEALKLMSSELKTVYRQIEQHMASARSTTITTYYAMGQLIQAVNEHPENYTSTDGTTGISLLKMVFGSDKSTLLKSAQFARTCEPDEVTQLLGLRNDDTGFCLTWKHIIYLITIETKAARLAYAETAVRKCLDPASLSQLLQKKTGRSGSGGRPHTQPKSVWAMLTNIVKVSKDFVSRQESVWDGTENSIFTELIAITETEDIEWAHVETANEIATLMTQIAAYATSNSQRAIQVGQHLQQLIDRREAAIAMMNANDMQATRSVHIES